MLSFGWPEMLIVAAAALIIVGPKDLPLLLRNIGRVIGKVRRMGNDFKSELNKVAALDDIKDIKKSVTQPLSDTRSDIEKEFNKINIDGSVEPSGKMKSKNPDAKDVYEDIKSASAKTIAEPDSPSAAKASMSAAVTGATTANLAKEKQQQELAEGAKKPLKKTTTSKTKPKTKKPIKRKSPTKKTTPKRKKASKKSE